VYAALPLLFCRSEPARDGGLTVNDVRRSRSNIQTLPTRLSACPSETRSLAVTHYAEPPLSLSRGAGGSRSKASGELTLGLLSGGGYAALPLLFCRSEPAREKRKSNALRQSARVIVNDHREQARSYRFLWCGQNRMYTAHPRRSKLARDGGLSVKSVYRQVKQSDPSHKIFRLPVGSAISSL
jgi:hypothetical protein